MTLVLKKPPAEENTKELLIMITLGAKFSQPMHGDRRKSFLLGMKCDNPQVWYKFTITEIKQEGKNFFLLSVIRKSGFSSGISFSLET